MTAPIPLGCRPAVDQLLIRVYNLGVMTASQVIEEIQHLAPKERAKVIDYVKRLQRRNARRHERVLAITPAIVNATSNPTGF